MGHFPCGGTLTCGGGGGGGAGTGMQICRAAAARPEPSITSCHCWSSRSCRRRFCASSSLILPYRRRERRPTQVCSASFPSRSSRETGSRGRTRPLSPPSTFWFCPPGGPRPLPDILRPVEIVNQRFSVERCAALREADLSRHDVDALLRPGREADQKDPADCPKTLHRVWPCSCCSISRICCSSWRSDCSRYIRERASASICACCRALSAWRRRRSARRSSRIRS